MPGMRRRKKNEKLARNSSKYSFARKKRSSVTLESYHSNKAF
jgi:hypothetical protein